MNRTAPLRSKGFASKAPVREQRPDRSAEFASYSAPRPAAVMATPASFTAATAPAPAKLPREARTKQAIRDSANGEECHMRLEGVCNGRTDTTVWSHWPGLDGDRGMGMKALDLCGCYTCHACHDAVDGRTYNTPGHDRTAIVLAWMHGHLRSLVTLARKGIV
jgi:hypothetical protein